MKIYGIMDSARVKGGEGAGRRERVQDGVKGWDVQMQEREEAGWGARNLMRNPIGQKISNDYAIN